MPNTFNYKVVNCGGFSKSVNPTNGGSYLTTCQSFTSKTTPWGTFGPLTTARAFASSVVIPGSNVAYIIGGYNKADEFLHTAEKLEEDATAWTDGSAMNLPANAGRSHFCLVLASPVSYVSFFHAIEYLKRYSKLYSHLDYFPWH